MIVARKEGRVAMWRICCVSSRRTPVRISRLNDTRESKYLFICRTSVTYGQSRSLARMAAARAGIRRTSPPPLLWQCSIGSCYHFRNRRPSPQPPPAQPDSDQACCRSWALCLPHHHCSSPRASPCGLYHSGTCLPVAAAARPHSRQRSGTSGHPPRPWRRALAQSPWSVFLVLVAR
jgi:hypothetical protein